MGCCSHTAAYLDKLPRFSASAPESALHSQWITLQNCTLRYVRVGDAAASHTVVMMPDPPNTIEHMAELIGLLEKQCQVIVFEGPGFGFSTPGFSYDFSIEHNAALITEFLERLALRNVILAFTCVAGLSALKVAHQRPDIVSGLVLAQVPGLDGAKQWAKRVDFKGVIGTPFIGQLFLRLLRTRLTDIWYKNALSKGANRQPYTQLAICAFRRGARFSLASAFQALLGGSTRDADLVASQPATVLWGTSDRSHRYTDRRAILALVPNASMVELEGCAHFPDIEMPVEFAKSVMAVAEST